MRVLVIGPAAYFSTFDVFTGHVAGFKANGCEVHTFDYGKWLRIFATFAGWAKRKNLDSKLGEKAYIMAGESIYVTAHAIDADLVWMVAPMHVHTLILRLLKKDGIPTAGYMTECPYEDDMWVQRAELFDYCFLSDRASVARFKQHNAFSFYMAHAYDPARHYPKRRKQDYDLIFIGTGFPRRRKFLEAVDWEGVNAHIMGYWRGVPQKSPIRPLLDTCVVANEETVELYRRSRIGLQLHRQDTYYRHGWRMEPGVAQSLGPRSYELAACGVFQLSDERAELHDVFDGSVPTFSTPEELSRLMRHYLAKPGERRELAERQREAVQPHTFARRIREALKVIA